MQFASFALVHSQSVPGSIDRGILFTNEHRGEYGPLLPGGRNNVYEKELYDAGQKLLAAQFTAMREVNEELGCLFVPDRHFIKSYDQPFKNQPGEAWYVSGVLCYEVNNKLELISFGKIQKTAKLDVLPLNFLKYDDIKNQVKFDSMTNVASEYLKLNPT